jgi:hypothetical protein
MTNPLLQIRAHFDGQFIVPDEPVRLPINSPLMVDVTSIGQQVKGDTTAIDRRLAALEKFVLLGASGASISEASLRRENIYGDDGR